MKYEGCKSAAFDLVKEASERFGGSWPLNKEKYARLNETCDLIDELAQEIDEDFELCEVTVDVGTVTKNLIFNIVCDEIILEPGNNHRFFALKELADSVRFSNAGPDRLRIEITVHNFWIEV